MKRGSKAEMSPADVAVLDDMLMGHNWVLTACQRKCCSTGLMSKHALGVMSPAKRLNECVCSHLNMLGQSWLEIPF